jgi:hypothetical protein
VIPVVLCHDPGGWRRAALLDMIWARGLHLSELGRARIASCADPDTLKRWLLLAATASSEAEVFAVDQAR